jgi:type VI secretion system protein ImpG
MSLRERSFGGQGLAGEAGMFMFGTVLSEFLGLYASVNSFHELHVLGTERKEIYQWPRRDGLLPLL